MKMTTEARLRAYVALIAALAIGSLLLPSTWSAQPADWVPALMVLFPFSVLLEFVERAAAIGRQLLHRDGPARGDDPARARARRGPVDRARGPAGAARSSIAAGQGHLQRRGDDAHGLARLVPHGSSRIRLGDRRGGSGCSSPLAVGTVVLTYFVVNVALLSVVLAIVEQRSLREMMRPDSSTVAPELAAAAIGAQYALIWTIDPLLVVLIAIPAWVDRPVLRPYPAARDGDAGVGALARPDHRPSRRSTFHHSERVASHAALLARALGGRRPQCRRLSGAGFRRRDDAGRARRRRTETDRQHARLCAPGPERPDALVAGQRPTSSIPSIRSIRPKCSTNVTTAKDASAALDSYNPPHKLYRELKAKLAELRGQGDGPVIQIAEGPALKFTPARSKKQPAVVMEDPRVPQLRAKLGITENADDTHYDAKVAEAVRKFQDERRPQGHRRARRPHRQGASTARSATAQIDTVHRQHGALALAAAPARRAVARQRLCHSQHPRLHAEGDAERRPGLDHQGGDRQAGQRTPRRC